MGDRREDLGAPWVLSDKVKGKEKKQKSKDQSNISADPDDDHIKIEEKNRIRILAYSDSDSDVESLAQTVKDHLLPGLDKSTSATDAEGDPTKSTTDEVGATEQQPTTVAEQLTSSTSRRGLARLLGASSSLLRHAIHMITPGLVARAGALWLLRSLKPTTGQRVEIASTAAGALALLVQRRRISASTAQAEASSIAYSSIAARQAIELGKAALVVSLLRLMHHFHETTLKGRVFRLTSGVDVSALEDAVPFDPDNPPESSKEWAAVYRPEMREMRRMLTECGIELPFPRFDSTNAELMRFAAACGLRDAETPQERGEAIEKAVRRIIISCEWLAAQDPLSESKLRRWERLVAWRGVDASGRKILVVRLGRALQLCTRPGQLETFQMAIARQIELGVAATSMSDASANNTDPGDGGPDRLIAVVDCRETSNWEALLRSRDAVALAKKLAIDLVAHYPGRLEKVFILELPLLARMSLQSIISPLPQSVKDKIVPALATDESLPVTIALLQKKRSVAKGLSRAMSDISLATSECSTVAGESIVEEGEDEDGGDKEDVGVASSTPYKSNNDEKNADGDLPMGVVSRSGATELPNATDDEDEVSATAGKWTEHAAKTAMESTPEQSITPLSTGGVAANLIDAMNAAAGSSGGKETPSIGAFAHQNDDVAASDGPAGPAVHFGNDGLRARMSISPTEGELQYHDAVDSQEAPLLSHGSDQPGGMDVSDGTTPYEMRLPSTHPSSKPLLSHALSLTPSTMSPQSTEETSVLQAMLQEQLALKPSVFAGSLSLINHMLHAPGSPSPSFKWASVTGASNPRGGAGGAPLSMNSADRKGMWSPRKTPFDAPSHGTSTTAAASSTVSMTPIAEVVKGGLIVLPTRSIAAAKKTPAKSSLRRVALNEALRMVEPLGSFPLRRQSSVSWAEDLERVKEIRRSRDMYNSSKAAGMSEMTGLLASVGIGEGEGLMSLVGFSSIVVTLMCGSMLQRMLG